VAGDAAEAFETETDESGAAGVMQVLREIFTAQGVAVPDPVDSACVRWGSDPFAFGSYSNISVGATGEDYDVLAEPVGERLHFAGEATMRQHPATMHGAFLSGVREAALIAGRGLHSFRFQLNLSSSVHRVTQLNPECVMELLKLSSNVNECKPLIAGRLRGLNKGGDLDQSRPDASVVPRAPRVKLGNPKTLNPKPPKPVKAASSRGAPRRRQGVDSAAEDVGAVSAVLRGRDLRSSTFQLNLSRFSHTSPCPPSDRLGVNHAPNVSHKMCLW